MVFNFNPRTNTQTNQSYKSFMNDIKSIKKKSDGLKESFLGARFSVDVKKARKATEKIPEISTNIMGSIVSVYLTKLIESEKEGLGKQLYDVFKNFYTSSKEHLEHVKNLYNKDNQEENISFDSINKAYDSLKKTNEEFSKLGYELVLEKQTSE